ncbi:Histone demethylase UTY [Gossypium arboreum]|uniref:Histone demethylase UTY n=1 Tax=Gossypium arboreum TaxID=29729 RepID=A0A0B0NEK5_GOSAR|nr:Histone demethylase UTY [Gossypium arboreum]
MNTGRYRYRSYCELGDHRGSSPHYRVSFWNTGVCLSRVRYTAMLHGRVSNGVQYNCKLGSSTAKAHGRVLWPCEQVIQRPIWVRVVTFYWYQSYGLVGSRTIITYQMDPERAIANDVKSKTPAPAQGTAPSDSRPATSSRDGHMSVTEYEAIICKRFEDGLNEDIRRLVRILEIKKFVVLVGRACKAEDLGKEKRKDDFEAREVRKRSSGKSVQSRSKKFRDDNGRSKASVGHLNRDRVRS